MPAGPVPQWTGQGPRRGAHHILVTRRLEGKVHRGGDGTGVEGSERRAQ